MDGKSITVAGLGTIGSYLVELLLRRSGIGRLLLVDPDSYSESNLRNQHIGRRDVGRPKVAAVARRLAELRPDVEVIPLVSAVEKMPLGLLRCDAILGCTDSRASRRYLSEAAVHLGVPFVDAGVLALPALARVTIYAPAPEAACLQCSWSPEDYAQQEQTYPCSRAASPSSGTPAWLGAIAAGMQVAALERALRAGGPDVSQEIVLDPHSGRSIETKLRRHNGCRFEHRRWTVGKVGGVDITLGQLLGGTPVGRARCAAIRVEHHAVVLDRICTTCGRRVRVLRLAERPGRLRTTCKGCGAATAVAGMNLTAELQFADLRRGELRRTLKAMGVAEHDILALVCADGAEHHVEVGPGPDRGA